MKKKYICIALSLIVAGCLFTGCSGKKENKEKPISEKTLETTTNNKNVETADEHVEITEDYFGKINGMNLQDDGNSFTETFGAEGFKPEKLGKDVGIICTSEKYKDVTCIVYGSDGNHIAPEDVEKKGFAGYYIDGDTENKPEMTWKGLTWGASAEDIIKAYGEPTEENDTEMYTNLIYNDESGRELTFKVWKETYKEHKYPGLQDVRFRVFKADIELPEDVSTESNEYEGTLTKVPMENND